MELQTDWKERSRNKGSDSNKFGRSPSSFRKKNKIETKKQSTGCGRPRFTPKTLLWLKTPKLSLLRDFRKTNRNQSATNMKLPKGTNQQEPKKPTKTGFLIVPGEGGIQAQAHALPREAVLVGPHGGGRRLAAHHLRGVRQRRPRGESDESRSAKPDLPSLGISGYPDQWFDQFEGRARCGEPPTPNRGHLNPRSTCPPNVQPNSWD